MIDIDVDEYDDVDNDDTNQKSYIYDKLIFYIEKM